MKALLILTAICFIINIAIDLSFDGVIDHFNFPMVFLLITLGFGFMWYIMSFNAHNYTK